MTHETTPDSTAATTTDGGAAPAPRRRRRVTRDVTTPASAPQAPPAPEAAADDVVADDVTTDEVTTDEVTTDEVVPAGAAVPDAGPATVDGAHPAEPVDAPPAPRARRSRRVSRTVVVTPGEPATVTAAPEPAAAVAPAAPVAEPAEVVPGAAEAAGAPDEDAPEPAAPARRRRRAGRATGAVGVAGAEQADAPGDAPTAVEPAVDVPAADADAPRTRTGAGRRSRRKTAEPPAPADEVPAGSAAAPAGPPADAADGAADDEPARSLDVLAEFRAAAPVTGEQQPPARARLATTAVLFQSPDASARPRRRRAQASAGSPEEISQAAHADEPVVPAPDETVTPADQPAEQESAGRRRRGRGGRSRSRRDEQVTDDAPVEDGPGADVPPAPGAQDVDDADAEDLVEESAGEGDDDGGTPRRRRRRGGRGRRGRTDAAGGDEDEAGPDEGEDEQPTDGEASDDDAAGEDEQGGSSRRRRRRRRGSRAETGEAEPRRRPASDEVTALRGSTRLEAKRQRRREGRDAGRRRQIITESEFLARRESVERTMVVRERAGRTQIAVLEDGVLVEHYVSHQAQASMVGNVYLGRVQNVLPSMEAAFVDVGKGRNAVLYAGEVNWDAAGLEGQPRRIEQALKSGDPVLVQVTKDPIGHKGARLTSQVTLAGRYLVYVPGGGMTGISRKLPDTERSRLKKILRDVVPDSAGVIVRTAAEGASEEELTADIARLQGQWEAIEKKSRTASAPALLQGEPDMAIRVVRDIFNDDFSTLVVQGDDAYATIASYVGDLAPDLATKVSKWTGTQDLFTVHRVDEQLAKGMDRKVWLPSGGSLVIDRTEAMTVVDVNTGKFTGAGGTLEETVTRNNLEAAEEIVRQLRLRDIGGIIVIDFIDMVLESNRDLVLRRLVECLGRDRTKHQVAEVTSLGLVQMTRKRVGQGLVEAFSETCEHCHGRGFIVHTDPVEKNARPDAGAPQAPEGESKRSRRKRATAEQAAPAAALPAVPVLPEAREAVKATLATIAAAAAHAHEHEHDRHEAADGPADETPTAAQDVVAAATDEPAPAERLDVLAELASAGRLAVDPEPTSAGDPVLELHAVAPEVFAVDEAEDEAVTPEPVDDEQALAAPPAEQEAPDAPAADGQASDEHASDDQVPDEQVPVGQASDEQVPDGPEEGTVP